jgi:hypothetical protein
VLLQHASQGRPELAFFLFGHPENAVGAAPTLAGERLKG